VKYAAMKFLIIICFSFISICTCCAQDRLYFNSQGGVSQTIIRYTLEESGNSNTVSYFENNIVNRYHLDVFLWNNIFFQTGLSFYPANYTSIRIKGFSRDKSAVSYEIPFNLNKRFLLRQNNRSNLYIIFSIGVSYVSRREILLNEKHRLNYLLTRSNAGLEFNFRRAGRPGIYAGWGQKSDISRTINSCADGSCKDYNLNFNEKYLTIFISYSLPFTIFIPAHKLNQKKWLRKLLITDKIAKTRD
jgi:hypothetical protein